MVEAWRWKKKWNRIEIDENFPFQIKKSTTIFICKQNKLFVDLSLTNIYFAYLKLAAIKNSLDSCIYIASWADKNVAKIDFSLNFWKFFGTKHDK